MNMQELQVAISALNIRQDSYCLGHDENEALCIVENYGRWHIYYSERGQRAGERIFDSESLACAAFLARLQKMLHA